MTPQAVCFLVHANLQYAEIPSAETKNVIEKSYIPALQVFLDHPEAKTVMDFSGVTLEILARDYPRVIDQLRKLISQGNVELCGSTYASPMLPLIPLDHARRQIDMFNKIYRDLFGDLKVAPTGFFPHEYFFDASLVPLFLEYGFNWTPVNSIQFINSLSGRLNNPLKPAVKQNELEIRDYHGFDLFSPIRVLGASNTEIDGVIVSGEFYELAHDLCAGKMSWKEYSKLLDDLQKIHNETGEAFLFLGPSDLEFVGVYAPPYSNRPLQSISPESLEKFIVRLASLDNLVFKTPSEHLRKYPPKKAVYLKCGGDSPELDYWAKDPDNFRLNYLCDSATREIEIVELKLSFLQQQGQDIFKSKSLLDEAWKALMLAENADGRGWMPVPERRLFCYDQVVKALEKIKELTQQLSINIIDS